MTPKKPQAPPDNFMVFHLGGRDSVGRGHALTLVEGVATEKAAREFVKGRATGHRNCYLVVEKVALLEAVPQMMLRELKNPVIDPVP